MGSLREVLEERLASRTQNLKESDQLSARKTRPIEKRTRSQIAIVFAGIGIVALAASLGEPAEHSPWRSALRILSGTLLGLGLHVAMVVPSAGRRYAIERDKLDLLNSKLRDRVAAIAARTGVSEPKSRVVTLSRYGKFASLKDLDGLGVTVNAMELFSVAEIDFLIARQLAFSWAAGNRPLNAFAIVFIVAFFGSLGFIRFLTKADEAMGWLFAIVFGIGPAWCIALIVASQHVARKQSLAADQRAIEVTGDVSAAISALQKVATGQADPTAEQIGRIADRRMLERIQVLASGK